MDLGGNTQGFLPGLPIPGFGMGKGTDEGISPPRWVAESALALDTWEEKLHGARRPWGVQGMGNARRNNSCLVALGSGLAWSALKYALCRKKTTLDKI